MDGPDPLDLKNACENPWDEGSAKACRNAIGEVACGRVKIPEEASDSLPLIIGVLWRGTDWCLVWERSVTPWRREVACLDGAKGQPSGS